jgi:hypothetical protein
MNMTAHIIIYPLVVAFIIAVYNGSVYAANRMRRSRHPEAKLVPYGLPWIQILYCTAGYWGGILFARMCL